MAAVVAGGVRIAAVRAEVRIAAGPVVRIAARVGREAAQIARVRRAVGAEGGGRRAVATTRVAGRAPRQVAGGNPAVQVPGVVAGAAARARGAIARGAVAR